MPKRNQTTIKRRKDTTITTKFLPNKIRKIVSSFENIYVSNNTCVLKFFDKNNNIKILKISVCNKDEYRLLMILKQSDNKYLLKPEIIQKQNEFIYAVFPYKKTLIEHLSSNNLTFYNLVDLAIDLCLGIIFIHKNKFLHLDISPDNIFVNEDNSFCIGDYSSVQKTGKKNKHANLYLTPDFSPPEFNSPSTGSQTIINELSDEYSIAKTILSICNIHNKQTIDNNTDTNEQTKIDKKFINIISKACSEVQAFRYASVYEFKNALVTYGKKNKTRPDTYNFNLNINTSDSLFDSLKTIPITKKADDAVTNKLVTFFNTPAFITIAILLAILLPCAALYNIFFISNTDKVPMAHQTEIVTVTNEPVTLQLEEFDVKQNIITSISINILNNIAGNNIDAASLKILSANDNSITDITGITAFKNIEELYLSSNKITDIDALTKLKKLNTLVISSNSIDNISMLPQIQTLKNLDLSYNQKLKNIEPLLKLKSLKLLCITDTGITQKDILKLKKALPYCEIIY